MLNCKEIMLLWDLTLEQMMWCHKLVLLLMWCGWDPSWRNDFESDTDGCNSFFYLIKCLNLFPYDVFFHNSYMYELILITFIYIQWIVCFDRFSSSVVLTGYFSSKLSTGRSDGINKREMREKRNYRYAFYPLFLSISYRESLKHFKLLF